MWKEFWYTRFADLSMDVADLFEDPRQQPVPRLAVGASVYRQSRMAEEGVPENAERVVSSKCPECKAP